MKASKILSHLSALEVLLKEYSYEEMNSTESFELKKTFDSFKDRVEDALFVPSCGNSNAVKNSFDNKVAIGKQVQNPKSGNSSIRPKSNVSIANLSTFKEESMGDYGYLYELVRLFKHNIIEFIGAYSVHLNNSDWENLDFAAQKIKAGVSIAHADTLMDILKKLDVLLHSSQTPDLNALQALKSDFIQEYKLVEQAIDIELEALGNLDK